MSILPAIMKHNFKDFQEGFVFGRIDDVTGLVAALGTGNVIVSFELE